MCAHTDVNRTKLTICEREFQTNFSDIVSQYYHNLSCNRNVVFSALQILRASVNNVHDMRKTRNGMFLLDRRTINKICYFIHCDLFNSNWIEFKYENRKSTLSSQYFIRISVARLIYPFQNTSIADELNLIWNYYYNAICCHL